MQSNARVVSLIEQVGHLIRDRACHFSAEAHKLTFNQLRLLDVLAQSGRLAMADIATALRVTPASATSLVNRMVKAGWLVRAGDEHDRRKVWISIAEQRHAELRQRQEDQRKAMMAFTSVLNEDQLSQLAIILQTLVDRNS